MPARKRESGITNRKMIGGFTLVELIVSVGVFAIMSAGVAAISSSAFSMFGNSREIQRDIESAQFTVNTLAKYLRTSTVVEHDSQSVTFFDYSSSRCFGYRFDAGSGIMQARWVAVAGDITDVKAQCSSLVLNACAGASCAWQNLTASSGSYVTGRFSAVPSMNATEDPPGGSVGRVTIYVSVKKSATSSIGTSLQTTVSLRDYDYAETAP
ncbi:MAG: prepilin-type N-terminal cleavage/methylation domain-containing protein [Candidatus Moranbacteria bacterium]|nr:prepilin-type N-terminal cleavage/methylation domain-containing protein [Candidatus Moranbacteria bacterium]